MRRAGKLLGILLLLVGSESASACPWCQGDVGRQVRQGIFDGQFWANVLALAAPFPILILVVLVVLYWPEGRKLKTHA